MNELALFSGIGGISLGLRRAIPQLRTVCHVERDPYAIGVLIARMEAGDLDPAPVWDDVCTFDGRPWRGIVDIISGGFPCQDISNAGKGAGIIKGETRSGLWHEYARIIGEVRPRFVFVENVSALLTRGIDTVLGSLAALGYDAEWHCVPASHIGAPHRRDRLYLVAHTKCLREPQQKGGEQDKRERASNSSELADPDSISPQRYITSDTHQKNGQEQGERQARPQSVGSKLADTASPGLPQRGQGRREAGDTQGIARMESKPERQSERKTKPRLGGNPNGLPDWVDFPAPPNQPQKEWEPPRTTTECDHRADRIKCCGNAVVPQVIEYIARKTIVK